jgi:hypothetical protein
MNDEADRLNELLQAGYAAPPPDPAFARSLGERLLGEVADRASRAHAIALPRAHVPSFRQRLLPAAIAAGLLLAVTLGLLALRPGPFAPPTHEPALAHAAALGRDSAVPPQRWKVVHPGIRWGEADGEPMLGDLPTRLSHKLGETDLYFLEREPDKPALHSFFTQPTTDRAFAGALSKPRPKLKEPKYQSKAPRYGLLVFGPEAKTRVWVVLDLVSEPGDPKGNKDALYVDRNGNGDLTEPGERVPVTMREDKITLHISFQGAEPAEITRYVPTFKIGAIVEHNGKTRHSDAVVEIGEYLGRIRSCTISVKLNGTEERKARDRLLRFSKRPEDAPVIHFNGPLAMYLSMASGSIHVPVNYDEGESDWPPPYREIKHLVRGQEMELYAEVGTPGVGAGTFLPITANIPPEDVHPVAEIEFPHKDANQPAIKIRVVLKGRC